MNTELLTVKTDQETGELGLLFNSCPVISYPMVATEGLLVAHDFLEHVNGLGKIGSIDDELEALGGVWFVRAQFADIRRGSVSRVSPEESLQSDIINMASIYVNGVDFKSEVPEVDSDHYLIETFSFICDISIEEIDMYDDITDDKLKRFEHYKKSALSYMINGYEKACKKYDDKPEWVNTVFWNIAEAVDDRLKSVDLIEGQEFELNVCFDSGNIEFNIKGELYISVDIELDGEHESICVYQDEIDSLNDYTGDIYELESFVENNNICENLDSCGLDTLEIIQKEIRDLEMTEDNRTSLVIPIDDDRDMTVDIVVVNEFLM